MQTNVTSPRQSFQPNRTRYQQTSPVLDNLFSLIGLDTNTRYWSSTIFSVVSDSIQTNITGPQQSFQPYRTRYKQTLPVLDNPFSLIGLDTNNRYRSSTFLSVLSDSIQTNITGPRKSFQPYRTQYKQTLFLGLSDTSGDTAAGYPPPPLSHIDARYIYTYTYYC